MKGYLAELEKKSYLFLDPPPQAAGFRGAEGEATKGVDFPFVAPADAEAGGDEAAPAEAAVDDAVAEGAEEEEIERGLEEIEEAAPPQRGEPVDLAPSDDPAEPTNPAEPPSP